MNSDTKHFLVGEKDSRWSLARVDAVLTCTSEADRDKQTECDRGGDGGSDGVSVGPIRQSHLWRSGY